MTLPANWLTNALFPASAENTVDTVVNSKVTVMGSASGLISSVSAPRPAVTGPVYWMCVHNLTPVNARVGDIIFNSGGWAATSTSLGKGNLGATATPVAGFGQPVMAAPTGFTAAQMTFQDTFPGTSLNLAKWSPEFGANGSLWNYPGGTDPNGFPYTGPTLTNAGNCESGLFLPTNYPVQTLVVNNGLTILCLPNTSGSFTGAPFNPNGIHYNAVSGAICTYAKPGAGPGESASYQLPSTGVWYVQIRCKMFDLSHGCGGGVWFLPGSSQTNSNELDFVQGCQLGVTGEGENYYPCAMGYYAGAGGTGYTGTTIPDVGFDSSAAFHVYGCELNWNTGTITIYADGAQIWTWSGTMPAQQYQIMINAVVWIPADVTGWAIGYDGTPVQWEIAEVQAYWHS